MVRVGVVTEGDGDVGAVRALFPRLIAGDHVPLFTVGRVLKANGRGNLTKPGGVERFYEYLCGDHDAVLILVDADDDCAVALSKALATRLGALGQFVPAAVVAAVRMFESWFLADLESLAGQMVSGRALVRAGSQSPADPESIRNAKQMLTDMAPRGTIYKETSDQPSLSTKIDLVRVSTACRSFRRLVTALEQTVAFAESGVVAVTPQ